MNEEILTDAALPGDISSGEQRLCLSMAAMISENSGFEPDLACGALKQLSEYSISEYLRPVITGSGFTLQSIDSITTFSWNHCVSKCILVTGIRYHPSFYSIINSCWKIPHCKISV